jgi:hypothetical protein
MAYNIKLLNDGYDAPPATWEELGPMAQNWNRDTGIAGFSSIRGEPHQAGWHGTVTAYNFGLDDAAIVTSGCRWENLPVSTTRKPRCIELRQTCSGNTMPHAIADWPTNGEALATGAPPWF